jgi:hypothetical protein
VAPRETAQRVAGHRDRRVRRVARTQANGHSNQVTKRQPAQPIAQLARRGDDQGVELIGRLGTGLDRRTVRHAQHADCLRVAVGTDRKQDTTVIRKASQTSLGRHPRASPQTNMREPLKQIAAPFCGRFEPICGA